MNIDEVLDIFRERYPNNVVIRIYEPREGTYIVYAPELPMATGVSYTFMLDIQTKKITPFIPTECLEYWEEWTAPSKLVYNKKAR